SVDAALTDGLASPGLQGHRTVASGFASILAGTGLAAVDRGNGEYTLRQAPSSGEQAGVATLSAVTVTGQNAAALRLSPPTTIGSKIPLAQREIPQSVTVITQEQMQRQNMATFDDVLRQAPGITNKRFESYY